MLYNNYIFLNQTMDKSDSTSSRSVFSIFKDEQVMVDSK